LRTSTASDPKGAAFDPRKFYPYRLDSVDGLEARLRTHSGPQADIGLE
jgi:hypothetical protein